MNLKKTSWTTYYDISNELCDSQTLRCRTFSEKKEPYYYDDDHLSSFGAEFISNEIKIGSITNIYKKYPTSFLYL